MPLAHAPSARDLSVRLLIPFPSPPSLYPSPITRSRDPLFESATSATIGALGRKRDGVFRGKSHSPTDSVTHNGIYNGGRPQWRARTRTGSAARFDGENAVRARATRERGRRAIGVAASASERERARKVSRAGRMARLAARGRVGETGGETRRAGALLPRRARESVRAIAIIDFPFFPTAGNASPARPPCGGKKWTAR